MNVLLKAKLVMQYIYIIIIIIILIKDNKVPGGPSIILCLNYNYLITN